MTDQIDCMFMLIRVLGYDIHIKSIDFKLFTHHI